MSVPADPDRIVTLNPSAAQTMWEIGARDEVVGISNYGTYLDGTEDIPTVGSGFSVNETLITSLDPDLVLAPNIIADEVVVGLRQEGHTVYKFRISNDLEDIYDKTRLTGRLVGECSGADASVTEMRSTVSIVADAVAGEPRKRVLHLLDDTPYTVGNETFIHYVITTAGGENVAAGEGPRTYFVIDQERIRALDPSFISLTHRSYLPETEAIEATTASRTDAIVELDPNHLSQPAPRVVIAMAQLTKALHPRAYRRALPGFDDRFDLGGDDDDEDRFRPEESPRPAPTVSAAVRPTGIGILSVSNLSAEPFAASVEFPGAGVSTAAGIDLTGVSITRTPSGPTSFEITVRPERDLETLRTETNAVRVLGGFHLEHPELRDAYIENVTLDVRVDRSVLGTADADPSEVRLYRLHDGQWQGTAVTVGNRTNGTIEYRFTAPGASLFALGVPAVASVSVIEASASPATLRVGEPLRLRATIENAGSARGNVSIPVRLDGEVAREIDVSVEPGERRVVGTEVRIGRPGTYTVRLGDLVIGAVSVSADTTAAPPTTSAPASTGDETVPGPADDSPEAWTSKETPTPTDEPAPLDGFGIIGGLIAVALAIGAIARRAR